MKTIQLLKKSIAFFALVILLGLTARGQSYFQITASAGNTAGHITTIDRGDANGQPDAIVVVTPVYGKYIKAPLGVWYNGGKWKIYTEDNSAIPMGSKFNVIVAPKGKNAFKVKMPLGNQQNWMSLTGLGKNDIVIASHVYKKGGYNLSPVGVYQHNGKWTLYNELKKNIPVGMEFNVVAVNKLKTGNAFIHRTNGGLMPHVSALNNTSSADKDKLVFTTVSLEVPGRYNRQNTGVWWSNNKWNIYNQGREQLKENILFNVFMVDASPFYYIPPVILIPSIFNGNTEEKAPPGSIKTKNNVLLPFNINRGTIKYKAYRGKAIYQGDIVLGNSSQVVAPRPQPHPARPNFKTKYDRSNYGDISSQSSAITAVGTDYNESWGECLWNFGVIPYSIGSAFNAEERRKIEEALRYLDTNTNLTLKPRNGDSDYIYFGKNFDEGIGWSPLGRQGGGQEIMLGGLGQGHIVHEVLHSAGFWHEQSRPDRDNHIEILWDNIDPEFSDQFDKHYDSRPLGPYDYNSVMHYGSGAFGDGETTIRRRSGSGSVGRGNELTGIDKDGINILYDFDAVTLVTPPLNSTRKITTTIKRFEAKSGSDGCGEVEFFADISIKGGHTWKPFQRGGDLVRRTSELGGRLIAPRDWIHSNNIDPRLDMAKVVIRMKESDGGFCFADDNVDINPINGQMTLELMVNLRNGEIHIWDPIAYTRADYVGQANTDIPLQGFETRDSDNDESIPGHILFRIDVTNP